MKKEKLEERELRDALEDLSSDEEMIDEILTVWKTGQIETVKSRLRLLRSSALSDVHEKQNELYRIDFILRKMM